MTYSRLENIVKGVLLELSRPRHFYVDALVYARDILGEMSMDDMRIVTPVLLDINEFGESTLPCGYVDYVEVGVRVGQLVRPLVQQDAINSLPNLNSLGQQVTYSADPPVDTISPNQSPLLVNVPVGLYWGTVTINDYGENIGRLFGWGGGDVGDTFKIIRERNIIQTNETLGYDKLMLYYIDNGTSCNAASQVDVYANSAIRTYIKWQFRENSRSYGLGERQMSYQEHLRQRGVYRARKDDMTINDIKRIMMKNYYQTPHPY
jgi:hypothetical protein